ncbi:MAG: hypothetical protein JXB17_13025 [Bacteroidales bacterium]|nr:hypothetical protein [Bacteroidales bacterium]
MEIEKGEFLGTLSKTFGKEGQMLLKFNPDYSEALKKTELVLIEINNKPVPFFISEIQMRNNNSAIVKFHNYFNTQIVEEFVGCKVYFKLYNNTFPRETALTFDLKGYTLFDVKSGKIGIINELIKYPNNILIQIFKDNAEILVPFSDELVIDVNKLKKTITINIPEGLLGLNL